MFRKDTLKYSLVVQITMLSVCRDDLDCSAILSCLSLSFKQLRVHTLFNAIFWIVQLCDRWCCYTLWSVTFISPYAVDSYIYSVSYMYHVILTWSVTWSVTFGFQCLDLYPHITLTLFIDIASVMWLVGIRLFDKVCCYFVLPTNGFLGAAFSQVK